MTKLLFLPFTVPPHGEKRTETPLPLSACPRLPSCREAARGLSLGFLISSLGCNSARAQLSLPLWLQESARSRQSRRRTTPYYILVLIIKQSNSFSQFERRKRRLPLPPTAPGQENRLPPVPRDTNGGSHPAVTAPRGCGGIRLQLPEFRTFPLGRTRPFRGITQREATETRADGNRRQAALSPSPGQRCGMRPRLPREGAAAPGGPRLCRRYKNPPGSLSENPREPEREQHPGSAPPASPSALVYQFFSSKLKLEDPQAQIWHQTTTNPPHGRKEFLRNGAFGKKEGERN
ncbi:uncharacterized protein ACIB01_013813 [Guaruba guarouba]